MKNQKEKSAKLRQDAESELSASNRSSFDKFEHELNVHEIELHMQNQELLLTQEKLQIALNEFIHLFEYSPVSYFIIDKSGLIYQANDTAAELTDYAKADLIGISLAAFFADESEKDIFHRHIRLVIKSNVIKLMEGTIKKKDNSLVSVLLKTVSNRDENLQLKNLLCIISDVSSIKIHEKHIEQLLKKSEELVKLKSYIVSLASHEFRTPLGALLSSSELLELFLTRGQNDLALKQIQKIKSSISTLVFIMDEFLTVDRLDTNIHSINKQDFNLRELCEDIIINFNISLGKTNLINFEQNGPEIFNGDLEMIKIIIQNLVSNALKFSIKNDAVYLFIEISDKKLTIKVADTGLGIPEVEHKNVYASFFRAQNTKFIQGTGLGLAIVKQYVDLLKGVIEFNSAENVGTTFTVTL